MGSHHIRFPPPGRNRHRGMDRSMCIIVFFLCFLHVVYLTGSARICKDMVPNKNTNCGKGACGRHLKANTKTAEQCRCLCSIVEKCEHWAWHQKGSKSGNWKLGDCSLVETSVGTYRNSDSNTITGSCVPAKPLAKESDTSKLSAHKICGKAKSELSTCESELRKYKTEQEIKLCENEAQWVKKLQEEKKRAQKTCPPGGD